MQRLRAVAAAKGLMAMYSESERRTWAPESIAMALDPRNYVIPI